VADGPEDRLREAGEAILAGVERCLPGWVEAQVERLLDAWGRAEPGVRTRAKAEAAAAGARAATRVSAELRALFTVDPVAQRAAPLEIVRRAYREPTAVLVAAGVPAVVRDPFDERAWPDDRYGLVVRNLGDLGDPDLAPLHLVWGVAKAAVLRSRREL